jgi:hypothetical protein
VRLSFVKLTQVLYQLIENINAEVKESNTQLERTKNSNREDEEEELYVYIHIRFQTTFS